MSEKRHLTSDQLSNLVTDCPVPGSLWRHCKTGGLYSVRDRVIIEATNEPAVVYRSEATCISWVRPLSEWKDRFEQVGE